LRTRAIEIVDDSGKVRAQLDVEKTGDVVFRLRDAKGTIHAKFGARESGSGLSNHRIKNEAPLGRYGGGHRSAVRNGVPVLRTGRDGVGVVKSKASTSVYVPVLRSVASVLIWKSIRRFGRLSLASIPRPCALAPRLDKEPDR
jgi:hypothetical protein